MTGPTSVTRCLILLSLIVLPGCSPACFLKPTEAFDAERLAEPPDYDFADAWAAMPQVDSKAKFAPPGSEDRQVDAPADVFFLYPTIWIHREIWNDPLDSKKASEILHEIILPGQASVFNECCRVFVPLYRQATIGAYFGDPDDANRAFDVAYHDVERAFETFIDEHSGDRPFIVAAHSQGSMYAMRLLEMIDADEALRERLVVAYIPGFAHPMSRFETAYQHLEPCLAPDQLGCVAAWDTYREGKKPDGAEPLFYWTGEEWGEVPVDTQRQCTNPITWRADELPSAEEDHLGAVPRINEGNAPSFWHMMRSSEPAGLNVTGLAEPREGLLTARCEDGVLRVPNLKRLDYDAAETSRGNYHLVDYELFYMNIRENARHRTELWFQ